MSLWDVKNDLLEDIKKRRGHVKRLFHLSGTLEMMTEQPSVRELVGHKQADASRS